MKNPPVLPGDLFSLRRNHQTALHHPDAYPLVNLEPGPLQPVAAQLDPRSDPIADVELFTERRIVIGGDGSETFSSGRDCPMIGLRFCTKSTAAGIAACKPA